MPQSAKLILGRVLILLTLKLTFQDDYCSSKIKMSIVILVFFVTKHHMCFVVTNVSPETSVSFVSRYARQRALE